MEATARRRWTMIGRGAAALALSAAAQGAPKAAPRRDPLAGIARLLDEAEAALKRVAADRRAADVLRSRWAQAQERLRGAERERASGAAVRVAGATPRDAQVARGCASDARLESALGAFHGAMSWRQADKTAATAVTEDAFAYYACRGVIERGTAPCDRLQDAGWTDANDRLNCGEAVASALSTRAMATRDHADARAVCRIDRAMRPPLTEAGCAAWAGAVVDGASIETVCARVAAAQKMPDCGKLLRQATGLDAEADDAGAEAGGRQLRRQMAAYRAAVASGRAQDCRGSALCEVMISPDPRQCERRAADLRRRACAYLRQARADEARADEIDALAREAGRAGAAAQQKDRGVGEEIRRVGERLMRAGAMIEDVEPKSLPGREELRARFRRLGRRLREATPPPGGAGKNPALGAR